MIVDKLVNCYSQVDNVNNILFKEKAIEKSIGTEKFSINFQGSFDLIYNHDLTFSSFGRVFYDLSIPPKFCFASYNDL